MPVTESSATALVRFTGLGIVCFNEERGRAEIAAIRDRKHELAVHIQRPTFQEQSGADAITYQAVASYLDLPREGVEIEIGTRGGSVAGGFKIFQSGDFDRLGEADVNDFGWIVNINSLHGGAALTPAARDARHPLTKIYVTDGLFYTHRLDADLFFERVERDPSGAEVRREVFGNVGETIGVKLEGEEVYVTVRAGGREETHTLKRVEGLPHRVVIDNMDHSGAAVYSDMPDYYGYLASPDGQQFDLAPVFEQEVAPGSGGSVNQKEFCHPVATDLKSIDDL